MTVLRLAAIRAASRPFYLASVVWPLAQRQPDPWAWIAGKAGVPLEDAARLLLCRAPDNEAEVDQIAAWFGTVRLGELLKICTEGLRR